MSKHKNVLVLGATGTTGSEVVRAAVEAGANVRAATRNPAGASFEGAEAVAFDPDAPETWGPALEGVDALYFMMPSYRPDEIEVGNAILDAAVEAGVKRIVKLSAAGVDAMPESAHFKLDQAVQESGVEWNLLRPTFFIDNFVTFYGEMIASEGVIALPAGDGRTGFIAASDIGDVGALALLGEETGQIWTLTGKESLTHTEVAEILTDVLDREVRFVDITPEQHIEGMKAGGMPPLGVEILSTLYGYVREGYTAELSPAVADLLGREPVTFREWAEENRGAWS